MPCCGQGRAALAAASAVTLYVPPVASPAPAAAQAPATVPSFTTQAAPVAPLTSVRIRYTREVRVRVTGPASGRAYEFSGTAAVQSVDARDAEGLVGTGYFRRVY